MQDVTMYLPSCLSCLLLALKLYLNFWWEPQLEHLLKVLNFFLQVHITNLLLEDDLLIFGKQTMEEGSNF